MPMPRPTTAALILVGAFEVCAWMLDPLGVHTALNDGAEMPLQARILLSCINGMVPVVLAAALSTVVAAAARAPSCTWSNAIVSITLPFYATFTFGQWVFWWWPYLLGDVAGVAELVSEHKEQLARVVRVLPPIGDHLVPDIEHTFLMPISVLAFILAIRDAQSVPRSLKQRVLMSGFSILWGATQLLFVILSDTPFEEVGAMLSTAFIYLSMMYVAFSGPMPKQKSG